MMTEELKPCPFCNGDPNIIGYTDPTTDGVFYVECQGCNVETAYYSNEYGAKEAWNMRA